MKDNQLTPF